MIIMELDVGCGEAKVKGCIGVDIRKTAAVDVVADANNLPFRCECFTEAHIRHALEHTNDLTVLQEVRRVLKQGGVVHIEVPNAYFLLVTLRYLLKGRYAVHPGHIHAYGEVELVNLLKRCGFTRIKIEFSDQDRRHLPRKSLIQKFLPRRCKGVILAKAYRF